ncbi:amidohydrolase [Thermovibrio ammonificans HB-1]|uniref:Amidohydrolase n=1 Tax=Thermovibrio ammonificans (strain DSM 15698 / JCM 12110 / HB-1) TaxID=648996 RepID=E8T4S0_THEA1|nr:amidohydrolase family protein [Thermovibrio ammonificans]ADU96332.1 amidohydrolase [Thermovibrio ammonificans HB-1]
MRAVINPSWAVKPNGEVLKNPFIVIKNGRIEAYHRRKPEGEFKKWIQIEGVLYPPFVNCHTHLELSNLNFNPDNFKDFFQWLLWIIGSRATKTLPEIERAVRKGAELIKKSGTYYVGDISSFGVAPSVKLPVKAVTFREFIGKDLNPKEIPPPLSIHSIYSVSATAIKKIATDSLERGYKFQMHLAETPDEQLFAKCLPNRFESLIYPTIGRKRYEKLCAEGIVDYLKKLNALNENLIAVHCTNLSPKEAKELRKAKASAVLCPRSNLHLKTGFPPVEELLTLEKVGLGTDGLSSNVSLSVVEELRCLYYQLGCRVPLRELLPLITYKGAKVLNLQHYGETALFTVAKGNHSTPFEPLIKEGQQFGILDFSNTL